MSEPLASPSSIREQLRRNAVALLSLFIAISALGYNTWRNEKSEQQRNTRQAAFRVLEALGELREVADHRFYYLPYARSEISEADSRLRGYGSAALARDLLGLMPPPAPQAGERLHAGWVEHFNALDDVIKDGKRSPEAVAAEQAIGAEINRARAVVLGILQQLD